MLRSLAGLVRCWRLSDKDEVKIGRRDPFVFQTLLTIGVILFDGQKHPRLEMSVGRSVSV